MKEWIDEWKNRNTIDNMRDMIKTYSFWTIISSFIAFRKLLNGMSQPLTF